MSEVALLIGEAELLIGGNQRFPVEIAFSFIRTVRDANQDYKSANPQPMAALISAESALILKRYVLILTES